MKLSYLSLVGLRTLVAGIMVVLTANLTGCAAPQPTSSATTAAEAASITGGLVVIRFEGAQASPPKTIAVEVGASNKSGKLQFAGRLSGNVANEYADYVVALPLAPDPYLLTGLNISGNPEGNDFNLQIPFTVGTKAPDYLGRMVLSTDMTTGQTLLRFEDHFQSDQPVFVSMLSKLKGLTIGKALIQSSPMILQPAAPATPEPKPEPADTDKNDNLIELTPLPPNAESLLAQGDRAAFKRFLKLPFPRAFVTNHAGAQALATGSTAAETALDQCKNKAKGKGECQVFAINDMLVSPDTCVSDPANSKPRGSTAARCKPTGNNAATSTAPPTPTPAAVVPATAQKPSADTSTSSQKTNSGLELLLRAGSKK